MVIAFGSRLRLFFFFIFYGKYHVTSPPMLKYKITTKQFINNGSKVSIRNVVPLFVYTSVTRPQGWLNKYVTTFQQWTEHVGFKNFLFSKHMTKLIQKLPSLCLLWSVNDPESMKLRNFISNSYKWKKLFLFLLFHCCFLLCHYYFFHKNTSLDWKL